MAIDTSLFPFSIERFTGMMAQVFGGVQSSDTIQFLADSLGMVCDETTSIHHEVVGAFPSKDPNKDFGTTSADAWVILWNTKKNG